MQLVIFTPGVTSSDILLSTNSPTCKLTYLLTHLLTHLLAYAHLLTHPLAVRRGHSPTSTSHGHRFDSELNRLAAETGGKGAEDGGNAPVLGETVQARASYPS